MDTAAATGVFTSMYSGDYEDNKAVIEFFESNTDAISAKIAETKKAAVNAQIEALQKELDGL